MGTVVVRFATDGLTETGIPTEGMVQIVADYIAQAKFPVTAADYCVSSGCKTDCLSNQELNA